MRARKIALILPLRFAQRTAAGQKIPQVLRTTVMQHVLSTEAAFAHQLAANRSKMRKIGVTRTCAPARKSSDLRCGLVQSTAVVVTDGGGRGEEMRWSAAKVAFKPSTDPARGDS